MLPSLPIDAALPQIAFALRDHRSVVIQAPTGSGKTTRVAPALLRNGLLGEGMLLLLQPRRVAARACARMMASQLGESVGETVGYQIRFEKLAGPKTRILVVTEGILTRMLMGDPLLEGVSCVVLDEFHERSIHTDLALAMLRELQSLRDDLRVAVMSATLDAEPVARFLGDCPVITAEGRLFPLRISHLEPKPGTRLEEQVALGLRRLWADPEDDGGHVLVFLPGAGEIRRTQEFLSSRDWDAELVPLHGSLSAREQDLALTASKRRRIILATNIAETSLTIEGVTAVVDTGYQKLALFDAGRATDRLDRVRISAASATQRAGRAGRTAPGRVVRLWSEQTQVMLAPQETPEIRRTDLTPMLLCVLQFHGPDLTSFPFFERPPTDALETAARILRMLGAVDVDGRLNRLGQRLADLPLHPRLAAILERAAAGGWQRQAATVCALLEERAPRGEVDLQRQYETYLDRDDRLWDPRARTAIAAAERQLERRVASLWPTARRQQGRLPAQVLAELMLAGYPDRLCRARAAGQGLMVGGRGVVHELRGTDPAYFLALELVERGSDRTAAKADRILPVNLAEIQAVLKPQERVGVVFDEERGAANGVRRLFHQDLLLQEKPAQNVPARDLEQALAEYTAANFAKCFQPDEEALSLLYRIRFAAHHLGEESWPKLDEDGLIALLPQLCVGKRKLEELRRLDWRAALLDCLSWPQRQMLDREVPERLTVPSGSQIRIDYGAAFTDAGYPVLAVRLQEVFGLADTPRVARGRVPLLFHLLAPNMRPAQVTRDLRNFWNTTYAEVRKELRQRYPKHSWPDDPWTAPAIRGARRRH